MSHASTAVALARASLSASRATNVSQPRAAAASSALVARRRRARVIAPRALGDDVSETALLKETTKKIRECARRGAAAAAVNLLVSLGREGATPDALATSACISACVNGKNVELARRVYDEIFEKGVAMPDEVAVAEMAKGYLSLDPPGWGPAMAVVNGARDKYGIELTSVTYNVLLNCCAASNDLPRAEEIIDRMVDEDVEPDMWTIRAVEKRRSIRSYVKKQLLV